MPPGTDWHLLTRSTTPLRPQVPHGGCGEARAAQMGRLPRPAEREARGPVPLWTAAPCGAPGRAGAPSRSEPPTSRRRRRLLPQPNRPHRGPRTGPPPHLQQLAVTWRGGLLHAQHGQPQPRMGQFPPGQEGLSQKPIAMALGRATCLRPPQSPGWPPSLRPRGHSPSTTTLPPLSTGTRWPTAPGSPPNPALRKEAVRPQTLTFSSRSQTVPSPTINNSGQYSRYPYSNLNQGLVNSTGMNQNLGLTNSAPLNQSVPRYPARWDSRPAAPQDSCTSSPSPRGSLNQMNAQTMHPSQPPGDPSPPRLPCHP